MSELESGEINGCCCECWMDFFLHANKSGRLDHWICVSSYSARRFLFILGAILLGGGLYLALAPQIPKQLDGVAFYYLMIALLIAGPIFMRKSF